MTKFTPLVLLFCFLFFSHHVFAQQPRDVSGTVADTLGTVPGVTIKLISAADSIVTTSDIKGVYRFAAVKAKNFKLTVSGLGYQTLTRKYTMDADTKPVLLAPIKLKIQMNYLGVVNITAVIPIVIKEDTVQYNAAAYKVARGIAGGRPDQENAGHYG
jgi:hypothetical protein